MIAASDRCICGHLLERHFEGPDQEGFREAVREVYSEEEIEASGGLRGCAWFRMVKRSPASEFAERPEMCECPAFRSNVAQGVLL